MAFNYIPNLCPEWERQKNAYDWKWYIIRFCTKPKCVNFIKNMASAANVGYIAGRRIIRVTFVILRWYTARDGKATVISIFGKAALNGLLNWRIGLISSVYLYTMCLCAIFAWRKNRAGWYQKQYEEESSRAVNHTGKSARCFHHHHSLESPTTFMIKYEVCFPIMNDNNYQYLFMDFDNDGT